jgi:glycyl-tRNA synthetase
MTDLMEAVTSLAKRRGIAFQSSEIYGGLRSSWDYGPLGVELRRNVRDAWWKAMVQLRDEIVGRRPRSSCRLGYGRPPVTSRDSTIP